MDYFQRLEPTPSALRNGRLVMVIVGAILLVLVVLMAIDVSPRDPNTLAIAAATAVTVVGHGIAYLGQPTLGRYRAGLVVMTVGIVAAFAVLLLNPFPVN